MADERILRIVTLLTTALATPLLIGCTIVSFQYRDYNSRRKATAFCFAFIPLAFTAAASAVALLNYRRHGRMPSFKYTLLDFAAGLWYVAVLIPIWAVEIGILNKSGLGLLAGYTTAPMIVNMFYHIYVFLCNVTFLWSWIFSKAEHECPNCRSKFTVGPPQVQEVSKGGERYSLLRGDDYLDEDTVAYEDARTSEEQVGVQGDVDVEAKGKGTIKIQESHTADGVVRSACMLLVGNER
ncbi:hypothetical protein CC86DRAFT_381174 [Ophiobolus disseminans]|uniref:MARVEL domain-containing protein n=1 Tax=Ophiobolus disseminans TaxID=1469910 RepID=A0A6A7A4J6_9PLEO|nr:hypothetical protein CC86DRAFT_381174 [Ophiobolus disseminans]